MLAVGGSGPPHPDDRHDPRARDGCGPAGERGPSRHGDGARPGRVPPLPGRAAPQPGRSRLARTRPFRALGGARVHPPVRGPPPLRLRPHAGRPAPVPAVGLAHSRPPRARSHAGGRDDHRPARPGVRERRRHGDRAALPRRSLQPAAPRGRRLLDLRDLLRRRPDGGRQPGGRLDRRAPRPRTARLRLRRQPHHDRRHDVALVHDRGQGKALRGIRLARPARRPTPRTSMRSSAPSPRRRRRRNGRP